MSDVLARLISNPLLIRAMHRPSTFTARLGLKYGVAIGIGCSIFSLIGLAGSGHVDHIRLIVGTFSFVIIIVTPLIAYTAAINTAKEMKAIPFELLSVTLLTNDRLTKGFVLASLYRFRGLLSLVLGFAPFGIIGAVSIAFYDCPQIYMRPTTSCQPDVSLGSIINGVIGYSALTANIMGICLLDAALGVFLALWWRNRVLSSLVALMVGGVSMTLAFATPSFKLSELLERNLFSLPLIYVACALFILLARPFARKAR